MHGVLSPPPLPRPHPPLAVSSTGRPRASAAQGTNRFSALLIARHAATLSPSPLPLPSASSISPAPLALDSAPISPGPTASASSAPPRHFSPSTPKGLCRLTSSSSCCARSARDTSAARARSVRPSGTRASISADTKAGGRGWGGRPGGHRRLSSRSRLWLANSKQSSSVDGTYKPESGSRSGRWGETHAVRKEDSCRNSATGSGVWTDRQTSPPYSIQSTPLTRYQTSLAAMTPLESERR